MVFLLDFDNIVQFFRETAAEKLGYCHALANHFLNDRS